MEVDMMTPGEFAVLIDQFHKVVESAYQHRDEINRAIAQVGEMYPAIPTESWQDRNGKGKYLYMLFSVDCSGSGYSGPGGKRKVYIGNKPDCIKKARQLAENRRRYEKLQRARRELVNWITRRNRALRQQMETYPCFIVF